MQLNKAMCKVPITTSTFLTIATDCQLSTGLAMEFCHCTETEWTGWANDNLHVQVYDIIAYTIPLGLPMPYYNKFTDQVKENGCMVVETSGPLQ